MEATNDNDLSHNHAIRVAELIHKSREQLPLTEEEQQVLEAWQNESELNAALFEKLHDRDLVTNEVQHLLKYDEGEAVSAVFKTLGAEPPSARKKWRIDPRRLLVAASLLILLGSSWWFFVYHKTANKNDQLSKVDGGRPPDNYKALLTLGNDSVVRLDGGQTPFTAMQGRTALEKRSGSLVYTTSVNEASLKNTMSTPRGGQYSVVLTDGTQVWLNSASSITYPTSFPGNKREVTVTGEAYFSVAENKAKPFIVTANNMKVEVVGTEFNVMAYSDEEAIRTTLVKGAVKASTVGLKKENKELLLKPGEQAALPYQSGVMNITKPSMDEVVGWRSGEFRFHETAIPAIMRQIARWYDVNVEYRGSAADIVLSGQISRKQRLEDLLEILAITRNVHFEIKDEKTIIVIPGFK